MRSAFSPLQLLHEVAFKLHHGLRIAKRRALDQEYVLRAVAKRIALGGVQIDAVLDEAACDTRQQSGTVAGYDLQHLVDAALVGLDADLGRDWKMLELPTHAPLRRRFERGLVHEALAELVFDKADHSAVLRLLAVGIVYLEAVECVAEAGGVDLGIHD